MKRKSLLTVLLMLFMCMMFLFVTSCKKDKEQSNSNNTSNSPTSSDTTSSDKIEESSAVSGDEVGVYYVDGKSGEYTITLSEGLEVAMAIGAVNYTGTYALADDEFTFTFSAGAPIKATFSDEEISLTWGTENLTFIRKIKFDVTFETNGGLEVDAVEVINGKTIASVTAPLKDGVVFAGWFKDEALTDQFVLGQDVITSDTTLYASYVEVSFENEYAVTFDTNYEGGSDMTFATVDGVMETFYIPTREGFTFAGWFTSEYEDCTKLSKKVTAETVYTSDTVLYAVWKDNASIAPKLSSTVAYLEGNKVMWEEVANAISYDVTITSDAGYSKTISDLGVTFLELDLVALEKGNYQVEVVANASVEENNSDAYSIYFANKALSPVVDFVVLQSSVLFFKGVENATEYFLTIEGGEAEYIYEDIDLTSVTIFDFSHCQMVEGGIKFTVTAKAEGFMDSVSKTFVYNRLLEGVETYELDEATQILTWEEVANATNYIVTVTDSVGTKVYDNGYSTEFDLRFANKGEVTVSIVAKTEGYNSGDALEFTYAKTVLATPNSIELSDGVLSWEEVEGATAYTLNINGVEYNESTNSKDLTDIFVAGTALNVTITAKDDAVISKASEVFVISNTIKDTVKYVNGGVEWGAIYGATKIEVRVNGGDIAEVSGNATRYDLALTQAGVNTIEVRYNDGNNPSEWFAVEVFAYEIKFVVDGGTAIASKYVVTNDELNLVDAVRNMYVFSGWYFSEGGASNSAEEFTSERFTEFKNIVLYAYFVPEKMTITLNPTDDGELASTTVIVDYDSEYKLPVPKSVNEKTFKGWYIVDEETGFLGRITDESGVAYQTYVFNTDIELLAYWESTQVVFYNLEGGGVSVAKGKKIDSVTTVTIPAMYVNEPVKAILTYAFEDCENLEVLNIPNTITNIDFESAFIGSNNLREINVYDVEGNTNIRYYSNNGVVMEITNAQDEALKQNALVYCPIAKAGEYTIPAGVDVIASLAFDSVDALTSVRIPTTVTAIETNAFFNMSALTSIIIEDGEGEDLSIDSGAFKNCDALVSMYFPKRATDLEKSMFDSCYALEEISISAENENYQTFDGALYDSTGTKLVYYPSAKSNALAFKETATTIGAYAFASSKYLTEVTIPSFITKIEENAFTNCNSLTSITFSASEETLVIEASAFEACKYLEEVIFEDGVKLAEIANYTFYDCYELESIEIPASVTYIGESVFTNCLSLKEVTFAENSILTSIGESAFKEALALRSITLPESIEEINDYAFYGCKKLESIHVPASVSYLGESAFEECISLKSATFAEGIQIDIIASGLFYNCTSLKSIVIPALVEEIDRYAFDTCKSLESVDFLTEAGIEIGRNAFADCVSLKSITLPKGITEINLNSFSDCQHLSNVYIDDENENFSDIDGVVYNKDQTALILYPEGRQDSNFKLASTIKSISAGIFNNNTGLMSITIPNTVESIGYGAFRDALALIEVNFELGGTAPLTIDAFAFYNCSSLQAVTLPNRLTSMGESIFEQCGSLETVVFEEGSQISSIPNYAFYLCQSLTEIIIPDSVTTIGLYSFYYNSSLRTVKLSDNLSIIRAGAFMQCLSLQSIEIPNTVSNYSVTNDEGETASYAGIGTQAFFSCDSMTSLVFEEGNENQLTLSSGAFQYCESLKQVHIPKNVIMSDTAFLLCSSVESYTVDPEHQIYSSKNGAIFNKDFTAFVFVPLGYKGVFTIPSTISYLPSQLFAEAFEITEIVFEEYVAEDGEEVPELVFEPISSNGWGIFGEMANLTKITIPSRVKSLPEYLFDGCTNLTTVIFEEGSILETIGVEAFEDCESLTSINIPNTVTSIGDDAFAGCESLATLTLSNKLETIGYSAFSGCESLTEVTIPASVTTLDYDAFSDCSLLETVTFADGIMLETIGESAFEDCASLLAIALPSSVKVISKSAFEGCESLSTVSFAEQCIVETIDDYAFEETAITSFDVPASVITIDPCCVFSDCLSLTAINFSASNPSEFISENGVVYSNDSTTLEYIPNGFVGEYEVRFGTETIAYYSLGQNVGLTKLTIPTSVTAVEEYFDECTALKEVIFIEGGTEELVIDCGTFDGNESIERVHLPARLPMIDEEVFMDTTALIEVTFEAGSTLTEIYDDAFKGSSIQTIVIPASVVTIYSGAFEDCEDLVSITFAEASALEKIEDDAFINTSSLGEVVLPASLQEIGDDVFEDSSLTKITLPEDCYYGDDMFSDCDNLVEVVLPITMTVMSSDVVTGLESLTTINLENIVKIEEYAFEGCESLNNINISNVTEIGYCAFSGCSSLTNISIPKITALSGGAFEDCSSLASIDLSNVTTIGEETFSGCTALTSVNILNITTFGEEAFKDCTGLTAIEIPNISNVSFSAGVFAGCTGLTEVTLPSAFDAIPSSMFSGCENLATLNVTSTIQGVGSYAFRNCAKLANFDLSEVYEIGSYAFYGTALSDLNFSNELNEIGSYAFFNCDSLTEFHIPISATTLGTNFTGGCDNLSEITIDPTNKNFMIDDGVVYDIDKTQIILFPLDKAGIYRLPYTVTSINEEAFKNAVNIEEIILHDDLIEIGEYAFENCTALKTIEIPTSIEEILDGTFSGCTSLTNVTLREGLVSIGNKAFAYCSSLKTLELPSTVEYFDCSFVGTALDELVIPYGFEEIYNYEFEETLIKKIVIPTSVVKIGRGVFVDSKVEVIEFVEGGIERLVIDDSAFEGCKYLKSINIPNRVYSDLYMSEDDDADEGDLTHGISSELFSDCIALEQVTFEKGGYETLTIGYGAFSNTAIKTIELPLRLRDIIYKGYTYPAMGSSVFENCTALTTVTLEEGYNNSLTFGAGAFKGCTSLFDIELARTTYISESQFEGCTALVSLNIPANVKKINSYAFSGCTGITSITLPSALKTLGYGVFEGWSESQQIIFESRTQELVESDFGTNWKEGCNATIVYAE